MQTLFKGISETEPPAAHSIHRIVLDSHELALSLGISLDVQREMRDKGEWLVVRPQGEDSWTVGVVEPGNVYDQKEVSLARATYLAIVARVQGILAGVSNGVLPEDADILREEAIDIYNNLPPGTKNEIDAAGLSPSEAFTTLPWD